MQSPVSPVMSSSWHGCSSFWKPGRIFGEISSSLKQRWNPRAAFQKGREVSGYEARSMPSLTLVASSSKPSNGSKTAGKILLLVEPTWLGPSAEHICERTKQYLSTDRAKEILMSSVVMKKKSQRKDSAVELKEDGLKLDLIRPVVDVLVNKFGPEGAGRLLDAKGSYLRWYKYGDRLELVIEAFLKWEGCSQDTVFKMMGCGNKKRGLVELGISVANLTDTEAFLRGKFGCDGREIATVFLSKPSFFSSTSFGPKSTMQLAINYFSDRLGMSMADMQIVLLRCPMVFELHVDQLTLRVDYLRKIGVTQNEIIVRVVKKYPSVLVYKVKTMEVNLATWETVGQISANNLCGLVLKYPNVLGRNLNKPDMILRMHFLEHVLCRDVPDFLLTNPSYVTYSFRTRIWVRTNYLKHRGHSVTNDSFSEFFSKKDDAFARKYGPPKLPELDFQNFTKYFLSDVL